MANYSFKRVNYTGAELDALLTKLNNIEADLIQDYAVTVSSSSVEEEHLKRYTLTQLGDVIGEIDIPTDMFLKEGHLEERLIANKNPLTGEDFQPPFVDEEGHILTFTYTDPESGEEKTIPVATLKLCLVLILTTDEEIVIPVDRLIDLYTGGETDTISVNVTDNVITASVKAGSIGETQLATSVTTAITTAQSTADAAAETASEAKTTADAAQSDVDALEVDVEGIHEEIGEESRTYTYEEFCEVWAEKHPGEDVPCTEEEYPEYAAEHPEETTKPSTGMYELIDEAAESSKIESDITVAGGPVQIKDEDWPEDWKDEAGNKIIPEDTSLQSLITNLFLKKQNGTLGNVVYTYNPTLAAPTVTLEKSGTEVEVGSKVSASWTATSTVSNNTSKATCTASMGYFLGDTYNSGNYTQSKTGSTTGSVTAAATWNNAELSAAGQVQVVEGVNTLKVNQSGITASAEALTSETIYAATNTREKVTTVSKDIASDAKSKALTSTASKTITGVRYMFGGSSIGVDMAITSDTVRELDGQKAETCTSDNTGTGKFNVDIVEGAWQVVVAVPAAYKVTKIQDTGALGTDIIGAFSTESVSVEGAEHYDTASYNVYVYHPAAALGANKYSIQVENA